MKAFPYVSDGKIILELSIAFKKAFNEKLECHQ